MNTAHPLYIYAKNRYLLFIGDLCVVIMVIVLLGIPLVGADPNAPFPPLVTNSVLVIGKVASFAGLIFSGWALTFFIRLLFRPAIQIDENAMVDLSSGTPAGRIAWDNIARVDLVSYSGRAYVGITLREMEPIAKQCGFFTRWSMQNRITRGFPPIMIAASVLGIDATELISALEAYRASALKG